MLVARTPCQKHLGFYLDEKLNFGQHINVKISKTIRELESLKGFHTRFLPRKSLITIYKFFIRSHLYYFDVIYDQQNNKSFCIKIGRIQYNVVLAITGTISGTSQINLYKELGLESLRFRGWFRWICTFFKIKIHGKPDYLLNMNPSYQVMFTTTQELLTELKFIIVVWIFFKALFFLT